MSRRPALVTFTSCIGDDVHEAEVAEVTGASPDGLMEIRFANGDQYTAYPEELEAIT